MTARDAGQEEAGADDRLHGMTIKGEWPFETAGCNAALLSAGAQCRMPGVHGVFHNRACCMVIRHVQHVSINR